MFNIRHKVGIKGSKEKVFDGVSTQQGLSNWWTRDCKAEAGLGGKIQFSFDKRLDKEYDVEVTVTEYKPGKSIHWRVITGPTEWLGTEMDFEIVPQEQETILYFTHSNWSNPTDFMAQCNTKWAVFLLSLKELIETGQGRPFPDDIRIGYSGA